MNKIIKNFTQGQPLLEGLVIVVSILLAFAIEAWWAEELDRQAEQEELSRLHIEFTGNLAGIKRNGELQKIVRDGTINLYQTIQAAQGAETVALSNGLLRISLFTPTYDVATPTLDALVLSGLLNVVQDNGVLAAIANWQRSLKNVTESEVSALEFTELQLFPSLVERGNMGPLLIVDAEQIDTRNINFDRNNRDNLNAQRNESGGGPRGNGMPPGMQFDDVQETLVRVDSRLEGLIAQRTRGADRSIQSLSRLEGAANRLIDAIERAQQR